MSRIKEYAVRWEINVDARNPREAARKAHAAQRRPGTIATIFDVHDPETGKVTRVDRTTDTTATLSTSRDETLVKAIETALRQWRKR